MGKKPIDFFFQIKEKIYCIAYDGNRLEGYYHLMKHPKHTAFIHALTGQTAGTNQCTQSNLNAGTLVPIEPGGRGFSQMVHMKGGPFT